MYSLKLETLPRKRDRRQAPPTQPTVSWLRRLLKYAVWWIDIEFEWGCLKWSKTAQRCLIMFNLIDMYLIQICKKVRFWFSYSSPLLILVFFVAHRPFLYMTSCLSSWSVWHYMFGLRSSNMCGYCVASQNHTMFTTKSKCVFLFSSGLTIENRSKIPGWWSIIQFTYDSGIFKEDQTTWFMQILSLKFPPKNDWSLRPSSLLTAGYVWHCHGLEELGLTWGRGTACLKSEGGARQSKTKCHELPWIWRIRKHSCWICCGPNKFLQNMGLLGPHAAQHLINRTRFCQWFQHCLGLYVTKLSVGNQIAKPSSSSVFLLGLVYHQIVCWWALDVSDI